MNRIARYINARPVRLALLSVAVNVALAVVKGLGGVIGHSQALIADAMESTVDVFGSLVVLGGLHVAAKPPDDNHPYGHGKAEALATAFVAMALLVGALAIAVSSLRELWSPGPPPHPFTLAILVGVVVLKEGMFRTLLRGGSANNSSALQADAWHHRADALTSAAAFLGVGVAVIGGEAYAAADDLAALLACGFIAYNGYHLLNPALLELMDSMPGPEFEAAVRTLAQGVPGVHTVETCLVRKSGNELWVDLHIEVDGNMPVSEGHRIAHEVKDAVRAGMPEVRDVLVHVEPAGTAVAFTS